VQGVTLIGPITTTTATKLLEQETSALLPRGLGVSKLQKKFDSCEIIMLLTQTLFPFEECPQKTHCKARLSQKKEP
jgi:hypothetical protein